MSHKKKKQNIQSIRSAYISFSSALGVSAAVGF